MKILTKKILAIMLFICLSFLISINVIKASLYEKYIIFDDDYKVNYYISVYTDAIYGNTCYFLEITGIDRLNEKITELEILPSILRYGKVEKISGVFNGFVSIILPYALKTLCDFETDCKFLYFPANIEEIENCKFNNLKHFEIKRSVNGINTLQGVLKGIPENKHCYLRGVVGDVVHFDIEVTDEYSPMECRADVVNETAEFIFNPKPKPLRF